MVKARIYWSKSARLQMKSCEIHMFAGQIQIYRSKYSHMLAKWAWVHLISQKYVRLKQTCFRSAPDLFTKGFLRCFLRFLSFRLPLSGAPAAKAGRPAVERWWNQGPNDLLLLRLGDTTRDRIGNWFRAKKNRRKIRISIYLIISTCIITAVSIMIFPFNIFQPILEIQWVAINCSSKCGMTSEDFPL